MAIDTRCTVVSKPPVNFTCDIKIDSLTMTYDEYLGELLSVAAYAGDPSRESLPVTIDGKLRFLT
ncbi:MAG: hypothetical protein R3208_22090 [Ketobacteraceae bacterium]|nr:hypothetical protein [Ketobacteraceae bacterium]